jgi:hypothetical protein
MCGASWTAFQRSRNAGAGKGLFLEWEFMGFSGDYVGIEATKMRR